MIPPEDLAIKPIAAAKTDAFQPRMKIAPHPNKKENKNESIRTLVLLKNISRNLFWKSNFPLIKLTCVICNKEYLMII